MNAVITFHSAEQGTTTAAAGDHRLTRVMSVLSLIAVDAITGGLGAKLDGSMSTIKDPTSFADVYGAATIESVRSGQHSITAGLQVDGLSNEVLADLVADFICIKARKYAESMGWTPLDTWVSKYL